MQDNVLDDEICYLGERLCLDLAREVVSSYDNLLFPRIRHQQWLQ